MEYFGVIAFFLVLCYSSLPTTVKKLEKKVRRIEKRIKEEPENM